MVIPLILALTFLLTTSCSSLEYAPVKQDERQKEQGLGTLR